MCLHVAYGYEKFDDISTLVAGVSHITDFMAMLTGELVSYKNHRVDQVNDELSAQKEMWKERIATLEDKVSSLQRDLDASKRTNLASKARVAEAEDFLRRAEAVRVCRHYDKAHSSVVKDWRSGAHFLRCGQCQTKEIFHR